MFSRGFFFFLFPYIVLSGKEDLRCTADQLKNHAKSAMSVVQHFKKCTDLMRSDDMKTSNVLRISVGACQSAHCINALEAGSNFTRFLTPECHTLSHWGSKVHLAESKLNSDLVTLQKKVVNTCGDIWTNKFSLSSICDPTQVAPSFSSFASMVNDYTICEEYIAAEGKNITTVKQSCRHETCQNAQASLTDFVPLKCEWPPHGDVQSLFISTSFAYLRGTCIGLRKKKDISDEFKLFHSALIAIQTLIFMGLMAKLQAASRHYRN